VGIPKKNDLAMASSDSEAPTDQSKTFLGGTSPMEAFVCKNNRFTNIRYAYPATAFVSRWWLVPSEY
jgi:hypothetical protein